MHPRPLPFLFAALLLLGAWLPAQSAGGSTELRWSYPNPFSYAPDFGLALDLVQDMDGDGVDEIIVGESQAGYSFNSTGAVTVLSGATGSL